LSSQEDNISKKRKM